MQLLWLSLLLPFQISGISRVPLIMQSPETLLVQTDKESKLLCDIRSSTNIYGIYWFRQVEPPGTGSHYQFLVHLDSKSTFNHGEGVKPEHVLVSRESHKSTLRLLNMKPSDSGIYICGIVAGHQLVFGSGTRLNVVDVLPTTPMPTKKTTPKKRICSTKRSEVTQQNGFLCSALPLSLLVGCAVVLLISLIVIIRINYLWNLARHHFVKQLQR
ncbi:T-cell surface glycoprotein CD8 beta chain [Trichosurus vulpecula]|uniref:T-cell surface glycoprotein CD8 beta chain n=1 Tax=Trichosurus vulpecula TaxID=9337 RepID=UPI00186AEF46|nr:T-cell surface glycoprotein CD8 beta chain [Trichosurus vulpecula]